MPADSGDLGPRRDRFHFGDKGIVDLFVGLDRPKDGEIGLTSPPTVVKDVVVVGAAGKNGTAPVSKQNTPGDVRGFEQTTLYAKVSGYVRSVSVERGQQVAQGQLLAEISTGTSVQQVAELVVPVLPAFHTTTPELPSSPRAPPSASAVLS